jgi:formylglycine-generating enzyme required for sulfatase activity
LDSPTPRPSPAPPHKLAPAGELPVPGGEIALGGEGTGEPLRRYFVAPFAIAETEVTNEQYQDFVKATGHKAPSHWRGGEFPPGTGAEPVTGVTWQDASDYCQWLTDQLGAPVRLPTEAEWESAARGEEHYKYPWGNQWNDRAAVSKESQGQLRPVKSFAEGKSPYGAYDMAGNVWEWVSDQARDEEGRPRVVNGVALRIIKGGSAVEPRAFISATSRYPAAADKSSRTLGFRYVVVRKDDSAASTGR